MKILIDNIADAAIWDTPDPILATNTDIENLKSISRAKVIRTNVTGTQTLKLRLLKSATISGIVLGRHTLPETATVRVYLYSNRSWIGPEVYDSEIQTISADKAGDSQVAWDSFLGTSQSASDMADEFKAAANWVHWVAQEYSSSSALLDTSSGLELLDTGTSNPLLNTGAIGFESIDNILSIKIEINLSGLSDIEIGRLIIGEHIEPVIGASFDHQLSWEEDSKQYRTEGSTLRSDVSNPLRKLSFSINTIQDTDRENLLNGFRLVGKEKDFYISMFDDVTDYSGIMKLTKEPIMTEFGPSFYRSKYEMVEV